MPDRVAALAARRWNEAADLERAQAEAERAAAADEEHRAKADESMRERYARWYVDPAAFAREAFRWDEGERLTDYQAKALRRLAAERRLALRSLHGVGKTAVASFAVLWFSTTREQREVGWKVPTTASVWRQLEKYLWPEIHSWVRRMRWDLLGMEPWRKGRELLDMALKLQYGEAFAAASDDPANIEGAHAPQLLYVFDEAKAIIDPTFDAAEGAFSGAGADTAQDAYALALSTPGVPAGRFWSICTRKPGTEEWGTQHVTLDDAIAAGRVSREWAEEKRRLWASMPGIYANRVLGEFAEDEDGVVALSWVEAANERWHAMRARVALDVPDLAGVDVARSGRDETVVALVAGDCVLPLIRPGSGDSIVVADKVAPLVRETPEGPFVMVDADGIGAGVFDQLMRHREISRRCAAFHAGTRTDARDRSGELGFVNLRSAAWWFVRELLEPGYGGTLALPVDDMLMSDLVAPRWEQRGDRIAVESKDDIAKRIGRSTDSADAVVMALWGRYIRAAQAVRPSTRQAANGDASLTADLLTIGF